MAIDVSSIAVALTATAIATNVSISLIDAFAAVVVALEETTIVSTGPTYVDSPTCRAIVATRRCLPRLADAIVPRLVGQTLVVIDLGPCSVATMSRLVESSTGPTIAAAYPFDEATIEVAAVAVVVDTSPTIAVVPATTMVLTAIVAIHLAATPTSEAISTVLTGKTSPPSSVGLTDVDEKTSEALVAETTTIELDESEVVAGQTLVLVAMNATAIVVEAANPEAKLSANAEV